MKRIFFAIIAVSCITACFNPFVSEPFIPVGEGAADGRNAAPGNIAATHGGKRTIEVSWDEVRGAVRYNVFKADSPLVPFVQCAETADTRIEFSVPAGSTVYYRVNAVASNGQESPQSLYVMGSSLAQPVITDITDITESSATVTWYMENATDATYKRDLRYTVYCFDKATGAEAAQPVVIDGSRIMQNRAAFTNLLAERTYAYQVEAYLLSDQSSSEKSEIMDRETARRSTPGAPEKLTASRGTSTDTIELSFELPEKVNIALAVNEYKMHGLYFVISKRFYSANGEYAYEKVCAYFGSSKEDNPNAASEGASAATFESYEFGTTVTWTDTTSVIRGVKYEYLVQSYVDGTAQTRTSDMSKAAVIGWTLAEGNLSIGAPVYIEGEIEGVEYYISATVQLNLAFDPKGEEYRYKVLETINPIGDEYDLDEPEIERESAFLSYEQVSPYTAAMDLTQKTAAHSPGRGLYSYKVSIHLPDDEAAIDTVTAVGDVLISEDINPIVVTGFDVQDGYTDKFAVSWDSESGIQYALYYSTDKTTWDEVAVYNDTVSAQDVQVTSLTHLPSGYKPGDIIYFAMQPIKNTKKGQRVYLTEGSRTLGVPELLPVTGYSYSTITAAWKEAHKADTYRIKYRYTGDTLWNTAETIARSDLSPDVTGTMRHPFKPSGYDTFAQSGKEIEIVVDALNEELRTKIESANDIFTASNNVQTRLVGPAELAAVATQAASAGHIEVSWSKVVGAGGYYVFRRQFNMANTAEERGAVVYYVPAWETADIEVTGKELKTESGIIVNTVNVKAKASFAASRYTLTDTGMSDHDYSGSFASYIDAYKNQQNELAWGFPYRYFIVPVLGGEPLNSIELTYVKDSNTKNTDIASYTLRENGTPIHYSGAAAFEKTGFTIGFGQNVTATKGTYSSNPSADYPTNSGIHITWTAPPLLAGAGVTPVYEVYRKAYNGTWGKLITVNNSLSYTDSSPSVTRGSAYEYLIGISNGSVASEPTNAARFIESCHETQDEKGRPNILGYMLDLVKMESVSRNEQKVGNEFAEEVKWLSAGVKNTSADNRWGIDGYTVFVMNRNIDANWHEIADVSYASIPNQTNLNVKVAANTRFADGRDLLRVMRDYKHFFKIRSYVKNANDEKVYSPDPSYDYEARYRTDRNAMETEYVKWGARQITVEEFAKIASLYVAWGIHHMNGGRWLWTSTTSAYSRQMSGNNGSSGWAYTQSDSGVAKWWFRFDNYKPDLDTRANKHPDGFSAFRDGSGNRGWNWQYSVTFLTIDTGTSYNSSTDKDRIISAYTPTTSNYPTKYDIDDYWGYGNGFFDVKGPSDISGMYTGKMRFAGFGMNANSVTSGSIQVKYPATAATVTAQDANGNNVTAYNVPLPFVPYQGGVNEAVFRMDLDEWY